MTFPLKIFAMPAIAAAFLIVAYVALGGLGFWGIGLMGILLVAGLWNEVRLLGRESGQ